MKYIIKKGTLMMGALALAITSCSDFSDYNSEASFNDLSASNTLWENILGDSQLTDFASVLRRVGYDEVLNSPNSYTVWAPLNGSFNMDSLAEVSDEKVLKEFVKNHVANYAHLETDVNDTTIFMQNGKLLSFANKNTSNLTFDGNKVLKNQNFVSSLIHNYPSTNGTLYLLSNPTKFRMNLYDYMYELTGFADSLKKIVERYDVKLLDEANSVKGSIVDGVQQYDEEVYIYGNELFCDYKINGVKFGSRYRCSLNDEDSLYAMIVPTNEAWSDTKDKMKGYFNYIQNVNYQKLSALTEKGGTFGTRNGAMMSATKEKNTYILTANSADVVGYWKDSLINMFMTRDLVYSLTNKRYNEKMLPNSQEIGNDSIYSSSRHFHTDIDSIRNAAERVEHLSNGYAYVVNEFPFRSWESTSFAPEIKTLDLGRTYPAGCSEKITFRQKQIDPSICTLDEGETSLTYLRARVRNGAYGVPIEMDFYLDDVLSTTYNVYVVMVPACIEPENADAPKKEYSLFADINYSDEKGNMVVGRMDPINRTIQTTTSKMRQVKAISASAEKVDTVYLGTVTFPICYKGVRTGNGEVVAPNLKIMHTPLTFDSDPSKNTYEYLLRVANVILRPVEYDEYKSSK